jgi:uncharacterized protein involved in response to NO
VGRVAPAFASRKIAGKTEHKPQELTMNDHDAEVRLVPLAGTLILTAALTVTMVLFAPIPLLTAPLVLVVGVMLGCELAQRRRDPLPRRRRSF